MSMQPNDIRLPGAVDLSGFRRPAAPADPGGSDAARPPSGGSSGVIVDVTEATFEAEVVTRSTQVPVIIDFWAEWCGPCKQLSPILERLALAGDGRWVLAKIDCDAEQRLAQAFQIQSIPSVLAVIAGQPVPLFQGALPEREVTQVVDEVLKLAVSNGVTGRVAVGADPETVPEPVELPPDPAVERAEAALAAGDPEAALASYRSILESDPSDQAARTAIARCELLLRIRDLDEPSVRAAAAADGDDVAAALRVADLDMAAGQVQDAITLLVELIRRTSGDDRDRARAHLLGLFEVLDPDDPRVVTGRRSLANALF